MSSSLAPIALFAFNRPRHLRHTLDTLANCPEAARSQVTIFCDGPRTKEEMAQVADVRRVAEERSWCGRVAIVAEDANRGLAASIVRGVTRILEAEERIIVIEDDIMVAKNFLAYMNEALGRFSSASSVFQVSGHSFPAGTYATSGGSSFLPFPSTWGWGTWQRAWSRYDCSMSGCEELRSCHRVRRSFDLDGAYPYYRMLSRLKRRGQLSRSWGICWYWTIFRAQGLVLYPHRTLTRHVGDDGSGTNRHREVDRVDDWFEECNTVPLIPSEPAIDDTYYLAVKKHLAAQQTWIRRGERVLRRALSRR